MPTFKRRLATGGVKIRTAPYAFDVLARRVVRFISGFRSRKTTDRSREGAKGSVGKATLARDSSPCRAQMTFPLPIPLFQVRRAEAILIQRPGHDGGFKTCLQQPHRRGVYGGLVLLPRR